MVSDSSDLYAYRAYLEDLINFNITAKDSHLTAALWDQDVAGRMDDITIEGEQTNTAFVRQFNHVSASKVFEIGGKLHCDLFTQHKYLPNEINVRMTITKNSPEFALMSAVTETPEIQLVDASLIVRKAEINPGILVAHSKTLNSHTAKFPFKHVDIKTRTVPAGITDHNIVHPYQNKIPNRLIITLVSNAAFTGTLNKNPFNFKHFNLNLLSVTKNGQEVLSKPLTPNFGATNTAYTLPFLLSFINTGNFFVDDGYCVQLKDYPNGYCIFAYDITPDLSANASHWSVYEEGDLSIYLKFANALTESVTVIMYGEFPDVLEIDKNRQCAVEYKRS